MPRIARLVVCGFALVIAIFSPTSAFVSVDLPTLGRPTKVTNPLRVCSVIFSLLGCRGALDEYGGDAPPTSARCPAGQDQSADLGGDAGLRHLVDRLAEQPADRVDVVVLEFDPEQITDVE